MVESRTILALIVSCLTTLALTLPVVRLLRRRNLLDVPNARSSHSQPTPRGGGVAAVLGLIAGVACGGVPHALWVLMGAVIVAAVLGLMDDLRDLSPLFRLTSQALLASATALAVVHLAGSGGLPGALFVAVAVVWATGFVNAFNFMDGINGISAVSGGIAGGWFVVVGHSASDRVLVLGGAVLVGACAGFLPWNFPRARVFLGDVGSYGLGALVGFLSVWALAVGVEALPAVAPLLLYVADTGFTLVSRLRRGESWMEAHRDHVYQRLCDVGLAQPVVTFLVAAATTAVCVSVWIVPGQVALLPVIAVLVCYLLLPRMLSGRPQRAVS